MSANIVLTGLSTSDPLPGNYVEVNFAVGGAAGFQGQRPILLIGNKTSAGDATVETVIYGPTSDLPIQTEQDVIARFGTGSELHRMWRRVQAVNGLTSCYAIAVAESGGAQATLTVTYTTTAAADGNTKVWIGDEFVDVAIASGDTVTTIATAVKNAINAKTHWGVTATNSAGVITVTARQKGPRGNFLRGSAAVYGTGISTTVTPTAVTAFSGGTTEDDYTNALATLNPKLFYYIVSASNIGASASDQLAKLITQVGTQALPTNGIRQRVFAGHVGTSAAAVTLATSAQMNAARAELTWSQNSDWTPAELAANMAAVASLEELGDPPRNNFSGYGNDTSTRATWLVPAPRDGTTPTKATQRTLLNNGVTPIGVNPNGSTYIVKRITTRSLNGSNPDYRIRDSHRVTQLDFFADDLLAKLSTQYTGKDLGNDLAAGQKPTAANLVTPSMIKAAVLRLIDDYAEAGRFKNVATIKAGVVVQRNSLNNNRVDIRIPAQVVDVLDQTATALDQIS